MLTAHETGSRFFGLLLAAGMILTPAAVPAVPDATKPLSIQGCARHRQTQLPQGINKAMDSMAIVQNGDHIGSGVMISPHGYILTAAHVVERTGTVAVYLNNKEAVSGTVIRIDPKQDVALVKIAGEHHPCLPLQRQGPTVGSEVFGIGVRLQSPLAFMVTRARVNGYRAEKNGIAYIKTDGNLVSGNSGGPLLNRQGEVVGIVSWKLTLVQAGREAGVLSFGAPINKAEHAMRISLR